MQKLAFFDIDGTVFRSSLLIELVKEFIARGLFPAAAESEYRASYDEWWKRQGSYEDYINALIQTYLKHIKGVHYSDLVTTGEAVVAKQKHRVYRYTRDLIQDLKADDYQIMAISQSPKTVLDDFCVNYGFTKVYGRIYELGPQDRFTGVVTDEHWISNKANIVKRVLEQNPNFTLKDSVAVGDTEGDIPLLEQVENPICFNPNQALFDHAQRMKWTVVVERKDVIYHL
jgi:HAD superfamily hydrolase (TIGR01490 family)